nr:hypothetical protein [Tanacetum cinerariifolium]
MCTKFLADETEKVNKYISGLPDNIHGNVMSARPKTIDETIELANDLMDQKLRTYAKRRNENKRNTNDSSRNNQQQPHKKQNVAMAYTAGPHDHSTRLVQHLAEYRLHRPSESSTQTMACIILMEVHDKGWGRWCYSARVMGEKTVGYVIGHMGVYGNDLVQWRYRIRAGDDRATMHVYWAGKLLVLL